MQSFRKWASSFIVRNLDSRLVFSLDFFLSLFSSAAVLLLMDFLSEFDYSTVRFMTLWLGSSAVGMAGSAFFFKGHKIIIRYSTLKDTGPFIAEIFVKIAVMCISLTLFWTISRSIVIALFCDLLLSLFLITGYRVLMILAYDVYKDRLIENKNVERVIVYGSSEKSAAMVTRLKNSPHYKVIGFIVEGDHTMTLMELPVFYFQSEEAFHRIVSSNGVSAILFASEKDVRAQKNKIVSYCGKYDIQALIAPVIDDVGDGRIMRSKVRSVKIEDLLGRPEIKISLSEIRSYLKDKVVMVTGAAGSIGSELCRQLAGFGVSKLVLFDNAETPMHIIRLELEESFPGLDMTPVIGDVRQIPRLDFAFRKFRPQVVFHAAAYKHVPLMEENPCEAVLVNVCGSRNVADKCLEYDVERMIMISTDKAVNPTNIMGCTKRLAEIYVQSLGLAVASGEKKGKTTFVTTRFGNVLGSNGSVIPRFREQIEKGGPVTVTDRRITRYFMTIPEACRLVMEAAVVSAGNRIYVFEMGNPVKIDTLARKMIELAGLEVGKDIEIKYSGLRPGEKLYEEVLADKEETEPGPHERIRVAKVREYDYARASETIDMLETLSRAVDIENMVKLMKKTVPEYKSENSVFQAYDK